jgi:holo-[acyl-carrier protein] synthase
MPESDQPLLAVGIDLVELAEVEESLERFGDRYLLHVFTEHERAQLKGPDEARARLRHLAACFASKEAAKKVLEPGDAEALEWQALEIHEQAAGSITVELRGPARRLAATRGITEISGSFTTEAGHVLAVVFGTGAGPSGSPSPSNGGFPPGSLL